MGLTGLVERRASRVVWVGGSPAPIRVLIGEDQPIVREGIVRVLETSGFEVAGTAADARDLVSKARVYRPDVVVTDIQMPPDHADDGLRAALEIRAADPGVGVLVLSQFLEDRYAFDLVADGAQGVGYLLKEKGRRPAGVHRRGAPCRRGRVGAGS
jgi:DNA-binding NarL/FixJ family response regulator